MFRFPQEYLSSFCKGRPSDDFSSKLNRGSYNQALGIHVNYELDEKYYDVDRESQIAFLSALNLLVLVEEARKFVADSAEGFLAKLLQLPLSAAQYVFNVIKGCGNVVIDKVLVIIMTKVGAVDIPDGGISIGLAKNMLKEGLSLPSRSCLLL